MRFMALNPCGSGTSFRKAPPTRDIAGPSLETTRLAPKTDSQFSKHSPEVGNPRPHWVSTTARHWTPHMHVLTVACPLLQPLHYFCLTMFVDASIIAGRCRPTFHPSDTGVRKCSSSDAYHSWSTLLPMCAPLVANPLGTHYRRSPFFENNLPAGTPSVPMSFASNRHASPTETHTASPECL